MTEPFVSSEVDRTKSKWVAKAFREFGRPKSTLRAFFYFCLQRSESDYPICGGFVGEIRVTRTYHESDGEKLAKWAGKAQKLGLLPHDAFLREEPGEHTILPDGLGSRTPRLELWLNRGAFNPQLKPVCRRHEAVLVSTSRPSRELLQELFRRASLPTTILTITDLSREGVSWSRNLAAAIAAARPANKAEIAVLHAALTPQQVIDLKIPMVSQKKGTSSEQKEYKKYLKPHSLKDHKMVELDALEVYHQGGLAAFADHILTKHKVG